MTTIATMMKIANPKKGSNPTTSIAIAARSNGLQTYTCTPQSLPPNAKKLDPLTRKSQSYKTALPMHPFSLNLETLILIVKIVPQFIHPIDRHTPERSGQSHSSRGTFGTRRESFDGTIGVAGRPKLDRWLTLLYRGMN